MSRTKKRKKKIPRVPAVGFCFINPEVLVIFHAYSIDQTARSYVYPPRLEGKEFKIQDDENESACVLLTAPQRILDLRPYAASIDRLLVFSIGKPEVLLDMGIPILDAVVENGKIVESITQSMDDLRYRIEEDAVVLKLSKKGARAAVPRTPEPEPEPEEEAEPSHVSDSILISKLKFIKSNFDGNSVEFEDHVLIPTMLRLIREIKRPKFKSACAALRDFGIPKDTYVGLFNFIEGIDGNGNDVGKAVRRYLWPDEERPRPKIKELAEHYDVSPKDVKFVVLSTKELFEGLTG